MMNGHARRTLEEYGLAPSKRRGQNFLVHQGTARAIVSKASFSKDDHVIEIGVGLGALTCCLAEAVARVTGFEVDRGIIRYHQEQKTLPANVELVHEDILKADFSRMRERIGRPLRIISNLPYSISNPFIFVLIDNRRHIEQAVVLLQKEVADRLQAMPGSKEFGVPSILLQSCARVTALMHVGPAEFYPRPKVDSSLIRIEFNDVPISDERYTWLRAVVRAAFSSRRKTVLNNLLASLSLPQQEFSDQPAKRRYLQSVLERVSIKSDIRAERIEISKFKELAKELSETA
ncbi:MAG: 16S rRNA (adenine(1518)-N(6)/adenine(1519)-N(6))-dimethyltransferase RsmA [Desulfofustis sp.]|jgi:16S rRNA (adenine1518-N6/adenine1519-N6)-dimethyltransferase|nr:16S rRNA (adenine(1518)-N(6)/adenine(1519)-N(6))-dimethyltransferase RsmA [Desulfofustis sp.]